MRYATVCLAFLILSCSTVFAQPQAQGQTQKKSPQTPIFDGPLELPCAKILAMPSSDYIAQIVAIDDSRVDGQLRGIRKYGACYDARTDAIAAAVARTGKAPTKAATAEFASLESAIKEFSTKAIASDPHPSPAYPREAFANLYEKMFRREFYEERQPRILKPAAPTAAVTRSSTAADTSKSTSSKAPPTNGAVAPHEATAEERARSDADPATQAKNQFGKILETLPDDQMHEIHSAFSEVIGVHEMSEGMRLAVYRYAIFLLQPEGTAASEQAPF